MRVCPVSTLVAPLRDEAPRGRDVPRPFVITPPADAPAELPADACWTFGLTLFGPAAELFPYVVLSRQRLESNGIGIRSESGRRGRVCVVRIASITSREPVTVFAPGLPRISTPAPCPARELIALRAAELPAERLRLRFDTPLRLKAEGEILRTFRPAVFIHRILERWEGLRREYATPGTFELLGPLRGLPANPAAADPRALLAIADTVRVERDETRWLELASYSSRQRQFTPIGGLLGEVVQAGDLQPLHDVLALGELIHVGKDVVKGNGCFTVLGTP